MVKRGQSANSEGCHSESRAVAHPSVFRRRHLPQMHGPEPCAFIDWSQVVTPSREQVLAAKKTLYIRVRNLKHRFETFKSMPAGLCVRGRTTIGVSSLSYGVARQFRSRGGGASHKPVLQYVKSPPALADCSRSVARTPLRHPRVLT
ncbi:unnamed protein product, partial [Iphiclides podalirius]